MSIVDLDYRYPNIAMCYWYGYNLAIGTPTCDKGHKASLKCHSKRKNCPNYLATSEATKKRGKVNSKCQ